MDAKEWDARYAAQESLWGLAPNRFLAAAVDWLGADGPGTALDVAAGEGRNAVWLATLGWQVTALDFSPVALAKAREQAQALGVADRVQTLERDVVSGPLGGPYDLAVVAYLQLPAEPLRAALVGSLHSVRPGGRAFLVGHDRRNLTEGTGGPPDPAVLWDARSICAWVAGLAEVEQAETVRRPVPGADRDALDTLVRLIRTG